jgi:hypothetical protein
MNTEIKHEQLSDAELDLIAGDGFITDSLRSGLTFLRGGPSRRRWRSGGGRCNKSNCLMNLSGRRAEAASSSAFRGALRRRQARL